MPARLPVQLKLMTIKQSGPWLKTVAAWAVGGVAQEGAGRRRETGGVAQLKGDGAAGSREPMEESTIAGAHSLEGNILLVTSTCLYRTCAGLA